MDNTPLLQSGVGVQVPHVSCFHYVTVRMENGFTLRESTTCVDPSNYDGNIGKEVCLKRIEDKIWFLLGYTLQSKLASK